MRKLFAALLVASLAVVGCEKKESAPAGGESAAPATRKILIGFVAKSQSNDVFVVAHAGAKAAAKELGAKYGVEVEVDIRTPSEEDATKQAEAIDALQRIGANAIAVSASEANTLVPSIDRAVERGVLVTTFDSDVPQSRRAFFYGCDDIAGGSKLADALAEATGGTATVAILAGNEGAPNLQRRVKGFKDRLAEKYPNMKLLEPNAVFYHVETPEKAAEAVATATNANPSITAWAFVGGWPLFTENALKWEPGKIKVVSWDALPAQLSYVRSGHVSALLAQDCYGWGYKSVEAILEKLLNNKDPDAATFIDPLPAITRESADAWEKNWELWLPKN